MICELPYGYMGVVQDRKALTHSQPTTELLGGIRTFGTPWASDYAEELYKLVHLKMLTTLLNEHKICDFFEKVHDHAA